MNPGYGIAAELFLIFCTVLGLFLLILSFCTIGIKRVGGKVVLTLGFICFIPLVHLFIHNVQIDIKNWNNLGPLLQAIDKSKYDKVKQLIEEGQDVNKENHQAYPSTPLLYAIDKKEYTHCSIVGRKWSGCQW